MSTTSIVLDFETLSLDPSAVITEIGAIAVYRSDFVEFDRIDLRPSLFDQLALGRTYDAATIAWARSKGVLPTHLGGLPFASAIRHLLAFIEEHNPHRIWAWGKDFERPLTESAALFAQVTMPPHQYRKFACGRDHWQTAFGMDHKAPERTHHALQDTRDELRDIHQALKELNRLEAF